MQTIISLALLLASSPAFAATTYTVQGRYVRYEHVDYGWSVSIEANDGRFFILQKDKISLNFGRLNQDGLFECRQGEYVIEHDGRTDYLRAARCFDR